MTVLLSRPGAVAPPRISDISGGEGHDPLRDRPPRRLRYRGRRFCARRCTSSRGDARFRACSCRRQVTLRHHSRLFRRRASCLSAPDLRDGYLRADPSNPAAVLRAVIKARDLVGTFDKPRYIAFTEELCAHSRSRIVGCSRCLDLCPTGAIAPAGDHVAIDATICAGCGQCAAVCPTGAAAYTLSRRYANAKAARRC